MVQVGSARKLFIIPRVSFRKCFVKHKRPYKVSRLNDKIDTNFLIDFQPIYQAHEKFVFTSDENWVVLEEADFKFAKKIKISFSNMEVEIV